MAGSQFRHVVMPAGAPQGWLDTLPNLPPTSVSLSRTSYPVLPWLYFCFYFEHIKKVVRVINARHEWDQSSMAASLEQDQFFADGCYHVNSIFCLCRRMGNTEAPCERWIGSWKYLYYPTQGPTTTTLCQRARIVAAGCYYNNGNHFSPKQCLHFRDSYFPSIE